MFTGIVEELGTVDSLEDQGDAIRLTVRGPLVTSDAGLGTRSPSTGAASPCPRRARTTTGRPSPSPPTSCTRPSQKTSLGALAPGSRVNLERAVTPATRLGGHIVQGHVDGTGTVVRRTPSEHWELVEVSLPAGLERYLVDKGSITVDGISLTVVTVGAGLLHGQPDPRDPGPHHAGLQATRRRRQPRGRRHREVRREDGEAVSETADVRGRQQGPSRHGGRGHRRHRGGQGRGRGR